MKAKTTVRKKFIFNLFVIFSFSVLMLYPLIKNVIEESTKKKIVAHMEDRYINSTEYIKQLFVVNQLEFTPDSFVKNGSIIVRGLGRANDCYTTIYSANGQSPYQYIPHHFRGSWSEIEAIHEGLLNHALENRAVTQISEIKYKNDMLYIVDFAFPVYEEEKILGIIRYTFDYTDFKKSDENLLKLIMAIVSGIFVVIFVFSYILTYRITKPISALKLGLEKVALGEYQVHLENKSNDELEDLTESFNNMKEKIQEQIMTIENEKEKIMNLQESRNHFFNNVTHELKTPLTNIYGYAQLLEENISNIEFRIRAIDRIKSESMRLQAMVVSLIETSKNIFKYHGEYKRIDISALAELIKNDMSFKAGQKSMKIKLEKEQTYIRGDINQIAEVFINVLDNAIKYGKRGSNILILIKNQNEKVVISIENEGVQIPESIKKKVFEPFVRGEKNGEEGSVGLGLYISKKIIEEHQGHILMEVKGEIVKINISVPYDVGESK